MNNGRPGAGQAPWEIISKMPLFERDCSSACAKLTAKGGGPSIHAAWWLLLSNIRSDWYAIDVAASLAYFPSSQEPKKYSEVLLASRDDKSMA